MNSKTRYLAEAALTVALTLVLSEVKIFRMPQGGSVTLENVPLIIMAMRWGLARGMAAGAVSGLLQFLIGGYMVHPVQMLLDYPAAYALLALAAFSRAERLGAFLLRPPRAWRATWRQA